MKRHILILLALLIPAVLNAANIYVDATCAAGSDYDDVGRTQGEGGGKVSYQTIAAAVAAVATGDTIYMRGGTYNEHDITIPNDVEGPLWRHTQRRAAALDVAGEDFYV